MKSERTFFLSVIRGTAAAVAAILILHGFSAQAQDTNTTSQTDFSSFRIIGQRNIFDPNRVARRRGDRSRQTRRTADTFYLVGTMTYEKGTFAFFDGTDSVYRKALKTMGTIADYTVTGISPNSVKLETKGKQLEMRVGTFMEKDDAGAWKLVTNGEAPTALLETTATTTDESPATAPSSSEPNDVLKKLMQQREQELK